MTLPFACLNDLMPSTQDPHCGRLLQEGDKGSSGAAPCRAPAVSPAAPTAAAPPSRSRPAAGCWGPASCGTPAPAAQYWDTLLKARVLCEQPPQHTSWSRCRSRFNRQFQAHRRLARLPAASSGPAAPLAGGPSSGMVPPGASPVRACRHQLLRTRNWAYKRHSLRHHQLRHTHHST